MTGYGALAAMMVNHQNIEAFRRFSKLNLENILHMQAELQHLEAIINEVRKIPDVNGFDRIWIDNPESMSEDDLYRIFERSRTLLDQYCKIHPSRSSRKQRSLIMEQIELCCGQPESIRYTNPGKTISSFAGNGTTKRAVVINSCLAWKPESSEIRAWRQIC